MVSEKDTEWIMGYVDDVISEAEHVLEELDPFTSGEHPGVWSVVYWLLPMLDESRAWCSGLEDRMGLLDDGNDMMVPVTAMELVLAHYNHLKTADSA